MTRCRAFRLENGTLLAGKECTFNATCNNISTQPLTVFERLGDPVTRVIAVDERMGIVWLRMAWGVAQEGGDQLCVWGTFTRHWHGANLAHDLGASALDTSAIEVITRATPAISIQTESLVRER